MLVNTLRDAFPLPSGMWFPSFQVLACAPLVIYIYMYIYIYNGRRRTRLRRKDHSVQKVTAGRARSLLRREALRSALARSATLRCSAHFALRSVLRASGAPHFALDFRFVLPVLCYLIGAYLMVFLYFGKLSLSCMFKIKCYRQNDRMGHVIISWFWLKSDCGMVITSEMSVAAESLNFNLSL